MKIGQETIICINVYEWIKNKTNLKNHFFHFANEGKRSYANADLLHKMGFKAGISDIFISKPHPQLKYAGLWIEVKTKGKKPTKEQLNFLQQMRDDGYKAEWYDNLDDILKCIKDFYCLKD